MKRAWLTTGILLLTLALLPQPGFTQTEQWQQGLGISTFLSTDSDDFTSQSLSLSYFPRFQHGDALTGIILTEQRYAQDDWEHDAHSLNLLHRQLNPATLEGWQLKGGWSRQHQHNLITLDGTWSRILPGKRRVEAFINRDWVETQRALESGTSFLFVGGVLEQGFGDHLTLVSVLGHQDFATDAGDDDNYRLHGRAKLIWQPDLDLGLTLQAHYRQFSSATEDVGRAYFNPEDYNEWLGAIGWRYRTRGWMSNITAGLGKQQINDQPRTASRLLELELKAPTSRDYALHLRAGYIRSASFQGPDYSYRYLRAEWIIGF